MKEELESDLEDEVVKWAEDRGGVALKLKLEERGFPDRTILMPNGVVCFVELKRKKKSKTYHTQKLWCNRLRALGFHAEFCSTIDDVRRAVYGVRG